MLPRIKICCISSVKEASQAISAGAHALGLVGKMPSGPGPIADELIAEIALAIPPPVASFLLTSETSVKGIIAHHSRTRTNTIQLVDRLNGNYDDLRQFLPAIRIVQVVHVMDESSIDEALKFASFADALLLDSGNPKLQVKELGGTGRVHNWEISRKIVEQCSKPVFLAGGLNPENARQALEFVQPFGLDVCSGLRTSGQLDQFKMDAFMKAVGY